MKLNNEKSKEIIISFAKNGNFRHTIPNINIDGIDVEQVDHAKLLGVTISHDMSWNKLVENIVKKAGKRLYMMYQLKRAGISQSDLVTVYLSVVRPVLEYACLCGTRIYNNTCQTTSRRYRKWQLSAHHT